MAAGAGDDDAPRMTAALVPVAPDVKMWLFCQGVGGSLTPCGRAQSGAAGWHGGAPPSLSGAAAVVVARREDHGVAQDLDQLLVAKPHVARAKEPDAAWALLLRDGHQLLRAPPKKPLQLFFAGGARSIL